MATKTSANFLLGLALLAPTSFALGQTDQLSPSEIHAEPGYSTSNTPSKGASWSARNGRKFQATVGGGFIVFPVTGLGLSGAYTLSPRLTLGLSYLTGSVTMNDEELDSSSRDARTTSRLEVDASLLLLQARFFVGNSFYVTALAGQRQLEARINVDTIYGDGVSDKINVNSAVVGASIGNEWTFANGLTLGADWIGLTVPVASSVSSSTGSYGTVSERQKELAADGEDAAESLGKTTTALGLVSSIGLRF